MEPVHWKAVEVFHSIDRCICQSLQIKGLVSDAVHTSMKLAILNLEKEIFINRLHKREKKIICESAPDLGYYEVTLLGSRHLFRGLLQSVRMKLRTFFSIKND